MSGFNFPFIHCVTESYLFRQVVELSKAIEKKTRGRAEIYEIFRKKVKQDEETLKREWEKTLTDMYVYYNLLSSQHAISSLDTTFYFTECTLICLIP